MPVQPSYMDVDIKGIKELQEKLNIFGKKAFDKGADLLTREMANPILKAARKNVPVRTKTLKKSIKKIKKHQKYRGLFLYKITCSKGKDAKYDGWYAHIVERGAQPHSVKKGVNRHSQKYQIEKKHPGFEGRFWLTKAFDENWRKAIKIGAEKYKTAVFKKIIN